MSVALYRKYRSRSLSDIVGQDHVTTLLLNALKSGKTAHAYLFTGPRGVGKTSIARILAHEINNLTYDDESTHLDIIEIDAASNNGVEDIRDLRERVQIAPVSAAKKVYIIDEVHMLSKQAFNALLKTLEEPPEHVVFILATTDIDKVPETIVSRTQRHTFRRASESDIVTNLKRIAAGEKITAEPEALELIAKHADGSFRDSVSLFDQLRSGAPGDSLTGEHVRQSLGLVPEAKIQSLIDATVAGDIAIIDSQLSELEAEGVPPRTTALQLTDYLRRHIVENPAYVQLIDALLEISKSHYPELKLLTALTLFSTTGPQPTTPAPPSAPPRAPAAPTLRNHDTSPPAPVKQPAPLPKSPKPARTDVQENADVVVPTTVRTKPAAGGDFDWNALITHVRKHHVALHSVLSKCEPELDGSTLLLYTKSAFYKKKLDDTRYRGLLIDSLTEIGCDFDIETLAAAKPLKDSQAAQVAAIMGGGEEVSVDDA